jgi:hypothetical protein
MLLARPFQNRKPSKDYRVLQTGLPSPHPKSQTPNFTTAKKRKQPKKKAAPAPNESAYSVIQRVIQKAEAPATKKKAR